MAGELTKTYDTYVDEGIIGYRCVEWAPAPPFVPPNQDPGLYIPPPPSDGYTPPRPPGSGNNWVCWDVVETYEYVSGGSLVTGTSTHSECRLV